MKKILSIILSICMLLSVVAGVDLSALAEESTSYVYGSGTLTKAEWLHDLSLAYGMHDESGYFENYYSDLSESHTYYNDIMLNVKYGTIDLEAGSELNPDSNVTREFAANSINALTGYYPTQSIIFSDSSSCLFPEDDQVAVEQGWISLSSGKFNPNGNLTSTQAKNMITALQNVKSSEEVDENYDGSWNVASGVIEFPETADVTIDDGKVTINNSPKTVKAGDIFVVYQYGVGLSYKALSVTKSGTKTIINTQEYSAADAFDTVDAQGIIDGSNMEFFSEAEGVEVTVEEENTSAKRSAPLKISGSHTSKIKKKVKISGNPFNVSNVKTDGTLENIKVTYKFDTKKKKLSVVMDGDLSLTTKFSASVSKSAPLIGFSVDGIAKAGITLNASVGGSYTSYIHTHMKIGFEFDGNKKRMIQDFRELGGSYNQTQVDGKVSISASVALESNKLISGRIFAEMGFKADHTQRTYTDGKLPKVCVTDKSCFFVQYGAEASCIFLSKDIDEVTHLYDYGSSPIQTFHHYEGGVEVSHCARGDDMRYYTKWNSAYWGNGIYSGLGYGLDGEGVQVPIFEYTTDDDGNATITKYNGYSNYVNIPEELDDHKVVGIADRVFKNHNELYNVVVPDTLDKFGNAVFENCINLISTNIPKDVNTCKYAGQTVYYGPFYGCSNLTSISFAEGTIEIADALFQNCGLKTISIPNTITKIGYRAFADCSKLKDVKFSNNLTTIDSYAFEDCVSLTEIRLPSNLNQMNIAVFYNCTGLTKANLPKNVNSEAYAGQTTHYGPFYGCSSLKDIEFASGYTYIDDAMFQNCGITSITLPDTITEIGYRVFANCSNLSNIELNSNLTKIGDYAFDRCVGLTNVKLPASLKQLGSATFYNCTQLKSINLPKNINTEAYAGQTTHYGPFYGCDSLTTVTFADEYTDIDDALFQNCGITSLTLPNTISKIGYRAFHNCYKLNSLNLNDGLSTISDGAFCSSNLKSLDIPDTVTSIGEYTFQNCENLTSVKLPKDRVNISKYMFDGCTSLKSLTLPSTIKYIRERAFSNSGLESITLPEGVETIEFAAFANTPLSSITFGGNEKTIDKQAFENCDSLSSITIPNSVTSLGAYVFSDCDTLTDVKLGTGITVIPQNGFEHCDLLKKIILPYRIKEIKANAFVNCVALTDITIPRATEKIDVTSFSYPEKLTITGVSGTYAETFANENSIKFVNNEVNATSASFDKSEVSLSKGASAVLILSILPSNFTDKVSWKSSNESIVTIADDGKITAKGIGTATVKATVGSKSASCVVNVVQPVTSISLNYTTAKVLGLDTFQLTATAYPNNAYDKTVSWKSSDESVATVSETGFVTALKKGTCTITATANDGSGAYRNCDVTVTKNVNLVNSVDELESQHNYPVDFGDIWRYTVESASALNITFNENTNVEDGFDYIYIYDKDRNQTGKYTGTELAGKTITVNGNTVSIMLSSDSGGTEWGFKVDRITPIYVHEHVPVIDEAVSPTCTETGLTEGTHCSICNAIIKEQEVVKALGHDYEAKVTPPTCTEYGYTTYTCWRCGDSYDSDETYPEHKWDKGTVIQEPTAYCQGIKRFTCTICGEERTESIDTLSPTITGKCGDNITYSIDISEDSPVLVLNGSGDMYDYSDSNPSPWNNYKAYIKSVEMSDEITSIGKNAFSGCSELTEVYLPSSLEKIETGAFNGCDNIVTIKYGGNESHWNNVIINDNNIVGALEKVKILGVPELKCELSKYEFVYNKKTQKPKVRVYDDSGNTLRAGTDYTVSYSKGRKLVGTYAVTVSYIGDYADNGEETLYFTIKPKGTSIKRLYRLRRGFKVKWKKQSIQTSGYQIQYSRYKSFKKPKTVTVKGARKTLRSIRKLTRKKTYYVRIRTYKTVNGEKIYSSWSKAKKVKTK